MASTIGIKIANGEFYPLVEENSAARKRLVLTTVHNKQRSVQIDLFRSFTRTMADAQYIGSLVVENITPRTKGEPSIEMVISSSPEGEISAEAVDLDDSGAQSQSLKVSLKSLDEDSRDFEIPDFDLDPHEPPPRELYEKQGTNQKERSRKLPLLLLILLILLLLIAGSLAVWYFVFGARIPKALEGFFFHGPSNAVSAPVEPAPAPPAPVPAAPAPAASVPVQPAQPARPASPPPPPAPAAPQVIQAPAKAPAPQTAVSRTRRSPPVASYKVPATIPREGVAYKIRWGDTLWDISEAFYRNPWLYPRIARFNNISNPDLIISGRTIKVPPRN